MPPDPETQAVRAIWEGLGLRGLVDVHTHFMPGRVMAKVWGYFDSAGPLTGREWPITYRDDEEARLARLRGFGVRAFTSLVYAHKPGMAAWLNQWTAAFAARTPDCLHTGTFYPEPGAGAYVEAALAAGARVFKVHVQVGDFDPNDVLLDDVWGLLADSRTTVVIHAGTGPAPGRFTGPDRIAALLRRFPRLHLVVAHMGLPEYEEFLDLADVYDGVWLDTTMAFTAFTEHHHPFPRAARPRLTEHGDRIVFGSDYPNIPYDYLTALRAVVDLDLGDAWLRAVLHDNGARLAGLTSD